MSTDGLNQSANLPIRGLSLSSFIFPLIHCSVSILGECLQPLFKSQHPHYYYRLRHHLHHHHNLRRTNPSSDLEILNFPYKYIVHIFIFVLHLSSNSVYNLTFYGFSTWDGRSAVIDHFLSSHRHTSEHVPRYTRQYRVGSCASKLDHHHSPSASSNQQCW